MKFEVPGRVAIFQMDAILGLSPDQAGHRKGALESLGGGRYRVISQNVKFRFGEVVEIIDGPVAPMPQREEALALGIRCGAGIGVKTLAARIALATTDNAAAVKAATASMATTEAATSAARVKAAKTRKRR